MTDVTAVQFARYADSNGVLYVYESGGGVPFNIRRVFTVSADAGDIRGDHAHKLCTQLLICVSGSIEVTSDDGSNVVQHLLDNPGDGLLVPPGVWLREEYLTAGAVLMVFCDRNYEPSEYIRDYNEFRHFFGNVQP